MASDRRVTQAFNLITAEGVTKYAPGDVVSGEAAEHWYVQAHSVDASEEAVESKDEEPKDEEKDEQDAGDAVQNAESQPAEAKSRKK